MVSPSVVGTRKALRMGVRACLGPVQIFFPITELKSEVGQMGLEPIKEKKINFFTCLRFSLLRVSFMLSLLLYVSGMMVDL